MTQRCKHTSNLQGIVFFNEVVNWIFIVINQPAICSIQKPYNFLFDLKELLELIELQKLYLFFKRLSDALADQDTVHFDYNSLSIQQAMSAM